MPETNENKFIRLEEKLNKVLEKCKKLEDVAHNQQKMFEEIKSFKKDFNTFKTKTEQTLDETKEWAKKINYLEAENRVLKEECKSLRVTFENYITDSKIKEMEIAGIEHQANENVKQLIKDIGKIAGEQIKESDLISTRRIENKKGKTENIHIEFTNKKKRDDFFWKVKKAKITCDKLGFQGSTKQIYANECLSPFKKTLYYETRVFKRNHNYKYAWVKNGRIFLRKEDKETIINITSMNDLDTLKK